MSLSYRNQTIDLLCKSMDWFLYDRDLRHESVKAESITLTLRRIENDLRRLKIIQQQKQQQ